MVVTHNGRRTMVLDTSNNVFESLAVEADSKRETSGRTVSGYREEGGRS